MNKEQIEQVTDTQKQSAQNLSLLNRRKRRPTMYRPSGIVAEKLQQYVIKNEEMIRDNEYGASEERLNAYWIALSFCELQDDDILSGLEIIAGMPREERKLFLKHMREVARHENSEKKPCVNDYTYYANCGYLGCDIRCIADWLDTEFIYRNGTFEVYEGEK